MKIFICASKHHYNKIKDILPELEDAGHQLSMPNSFDDPFKEEVMKKAGEKKHSLWKREMLLKDEKNIEPQDAILVLNFEKNNIQNYIGGATFLEIYTAFRLGKKIFLYNPIPNSFISDELKGMCPVIINGDLSKIY